MAKPPKASLSSDIEGVHQDRQPAGEAGHSGRDARFLGGERAVLHKPNVKRWAKRRSKHACAKRRQPWWFQVPRVWRGVIVSGSGTLPASVVAITAMSIAIDPVSSSRSSVERSCRARPPITRSNRS